MRSIESAQALAGRGLEGDRYFLETGAFSRWPGPRRQLTLIANEAISAAAAEAGSNLSAADLRRNIETEGIDLGALMGQDFRIGELRLRGLKLAMPCGYLERLSGRDDLRTLLRDGRGGIRAEILSDAGVRVGDPIGIEPDLRQRSAGRLENPAGRP